jgi:uncharacterized membrane protein
MSNRKKASGIKSPKTVAKNQQPKNLKISQQQIITSSGPIPSPEVLMGYKKIDPVIVKKIIQRAEEEAHHRHEIEKQAIAADIKNNNSLVKSNIRGQWFALTTVSIFMAATIVAIVYNQPWVASVIGGTTIVSVVGAFLSNLKK